MRNLINRVGNVILIFLILLIILSGYSIIHAKKNPREIPSVLGFRVMKVLSGSMRPLLQPGDMIISREISPEKIRIGDVITYKINKNTLVTHRVIEVIKQGEELLYKTKGDANNIEDRDIVTSEQVIGTLTLNIPKGGYIIDLIRSPKGFLILIILPIILLIIEEFKKILSNMEKNKKNKSNPKDSIDI